MQGPWFREIADAACAEFSLAVGVHLTLTSEWDACRWPPISTVSRVSGLIDGECYFWRDLDSVRRHLVPEAAEMELQAQVDRAIAFDIRLTYIDVHMAVVMLPDLLNAMCGLGRSTGCFLCFPGS